MSRFAKIEPAHSNLVAPRGSEMRGTTPDGKQVYYLKTLRSTNEPAFEGTGRFDEEGNEIMEESWQRHGVTNEKLIRKRNPVIFELEELFTLVSDGHFNVYKEPYYPKTPEQLEAEARAKRIAEMEGNLAAALVDSDMTPSDLIAGVHGELSRAKPISYPQNAAPNVWVLSNGDRIDGPKIEALQAEAKLNFVPVAEEEPTKEPAEDPVPEF